MGIPEGSITAPILFNIFLYDVPKCLSKKINAYEMAIWMNVSLREKKLQRGMWSTYREYIKHDIDNLNIFMNEID